MHKDLFSAHLKHYLEYRPETGEFFWKISPGRGHPIGKQTGLCSNGSYKVISLRGKTYLAHRVAWLLHTGDWPKGFIDHINGDKGDNRICNLRVVSRSQNSANTKVREGRKYKGVSKSGGRFQAYIGKNGEKKYLGLFDSEDEAAEAYNLAAKILHGDYARLNEVTKK